MDINFAITELSAPNPDYSRIRSIFAQAPPGGDWFLYGSRGNLLDAAKSSIIVPFGHLVDPVKNPMFFEMLEALAGSGGEDVTRSLNTSWPMLVGLSRKVHIAAERTYWSIGGYFAALGLVRIAEEDFVPQNLRCEVVGAIIDLAGRGHPCVDEGGQLPVPAEARKAWKENPDVFPEEWKDLMVRLCALEKRVTRDAPILERRFKCVVDDAFLCILARCYDRFVERVFEDFWAR